MDQHSDEVLKLGEAAISRVDAAYNTADFPTKIKLKPERDRVYGAWSQARRRLLENSVTLGDGDVAEMRAIGAEVDKAGQGQQMILAAAKLAAFLGKLAA